MRIAACKTSDVPTGGSLLVKAGDEDVLMFHLSDGFYATQPRCTHVFAPLKKGKIQDDNCVQCPFHRARFDIRTGEVIEWANFPPGVQLLNAIRSEKKLKTWPVEQDGDQLFVVMN